MTSIVERNQAQFVRLALLYIGVFAASTIVAVIARFTEERLALLWREFVTARMIRVYLADGTYYRLSESAELTNPDQRISEDARTFTVTTLSFALMAFSAVVAAFSLIVTQFQSLSNYAAVTARLSAMVQVTGAAQQPG